MEAKSRGKNIGILILTRALFVVAALRNECGKRQLKDSVCGILLLYYCSCKTNVGKRFLRKKVGISVGKWFLGNKCLMHF